MVSSQGAPHPVRVRIELLLIITDHFKPRIASEAKRTQTQEKHNYKT